MSEQNQHSELRENALHLAREMIEEIPASELPSSGLLLLSLALVDLEEQMALDRGDQEVLREGWVQRGQRIRELEEQLASLQAALDEESGYGARMQADANKLQEQLETAEKEIRRLREGWDGWQQQALAAEAALGEWEKDCDATALQRDNLRARLDRIRAAVESDPFFRDTDEAVRDFLIRETEPGWLHVPGVSGNARTALLDSNPACEHDWVTEHPGGPSDDFCRKCHVNRRAWRAASSPARES